MAVLDLSPLFRLVLRLAGLRIVFEVSRPPAEPGDDLEVQGHVEEICGSILGEEPVAVQDSRSPADPAVGLPVGLTPAGPAARTCPTNWDDRLARARNAGASAAKFVNKTSDRWVPAVSPVGQYGPLNNRTWVVVQGKEGAQDCRTGVICCTAGRGPGGMTELIGAPPHPQAVYHGFPSARELAAYLDGYRESLTAGSDSTRMRAPQ